MARRSSMVDLRRFGSASSGNIALEEAAQPLDGFEKKLGCWSAPPLPKRLVVLLNTDGMSAQYLYVAMTGGSMKLVVCNANPTLG
ncbi:hypothetical protein [Marinobacter adhaerens]|uniref:hypothetical protein n=1 Tax=Marinobacter adhaerens TaxID=1033846 RepID=UPI003BA8CDEF